MDEMFKSFKVIVPYHPNQKEGQILNTQHIKSGIIPSRPLILEFHGTVEQLRQELGRLTGFSIEGIRGTSKTEMVEATLKAKNLNELETILGENDTEEEFDFSVLVQLYGRIAIPLKNLKSMFSEDHIDSKL